MGRSRAYEEEAKDVWRDFGVVRQTVARRRKDEQYDGDLPCCQPHTSVNSETIAHHYNNPLSHLKGRPKKTMLVVSSDAG